MFLTLMSAVDFKARMDPSLSCLVLKSWLGIGLPTTYEVAGGGGVMFSQLSLSLFAAEDVPIP